MLVNDCNFFSFRIKKTLGVLEVNLVDVDLKMFYFSWYISQSSMPSNAIFSLQRKAKFLGVI